jgi:capsular exopolysaccharide synthesis family protein
MDLFMIWRLIVRHLPLVLVTSTLGLSLGLLATLSTKPIYSSTASIFVSSPATILDVSALAQGSNFTQQRVKSYAQLINAEGTLGPVIAQLGLTNTTPEKLASEIKATVPVDTVIIDVTVKDESPVLAKNIANAVAVQFSSSVQQLELPGTLGETSVKATLSREASLPLSPVSPKLSLNIALGILFGFSIGLFIAIAIHFGDSTVKNAEHLMGLQLLGVFKYEKKAKIEPLVSKLLPYDSRTEEYRQLRTSVLFQSEKNRSYVIGVTSALPVEGTTTMSLNLAHSLNEAGFKVILIESDMRRPQIAQYILQAKTAKVKYGLSDLLKVETRAGLESRIKKATFADEVNGMDVIFAGPVPSNSTELLSNVVLANIVSSLRKRYDYIVLDCPPVLPIADTSVMSEVIDEIILVVKAGSTRIQQFRGTVEILQNVNAQIMGVVLNMIPTGRKSDEYGYQYGSYRSYDYKSNPGYAPRKEDLTILSNDQEELGNIKQSSSPKSERAPRYAPKSERFNFENYDLDADIESSVADILASPPKKTQSKLIKAFINPVKALDSFKKNKSEREE